MFYYTGMVRLALWWRSRSGPYLVIVNYHRASGGNLRDHMQYFRRHYRVLALDQALQELYEDSARSGRAVRERRRGKGRSRPSLVLTFDDGYLDSYTHAMRYAQELELPITVFPVPTYVDNGAYSWWLAPPYLVEHTTLQNVSIGGEHYDLTRDSDRRSLRDAIDASLRNAGSVAERETFLADVERRLDVELPRRVDGRRDDPALSVTWDELREMESSGWVSVGAHTMNHPVLVCLTDDEELKREVEQPRALLEERLGHSVSTFTYPIGKMRHIGERGVQAVRDAGYQSGLTTIEGVNRRDTDPVVLRRLPGSLHVHWLLLASEFAGLLGILSRLRSLRARL
jgi:peptidoglycan/xylan/chitin deacetylase (PgdA/CDA1 family)